MLREFDVADKTTLDSVAVNVGNTADTGGSDTEGTVFAKLNALNKYCGNASNNTDAVYSMLCGKTTPYGNAVYGDLVVDGSFSFPAKDGFNRYILHTSSLVIPEGVTLTPPTTCDGLYILSQGDVTINGNIDVRGKRQTITGDIKLSPKINVGNQEFELAKGGYAPKGGKNGAGGLGYKSDFNQDEDIPSPSINTNAIAGNVNGGGIGRYAIGGSSVLYDDDSSDADVYVSYNTSAHFVSNGKILVDSGVGAGKSFNCKPYLTHGTAPCALVIIAKGKVTINGQVLGSGSSGKAPTEAPPYQYEVWYGPSSNCEVQFSIAGDGAMPPSGGAPVTIICNEFECNGKIDTSGKKETYSDCPDNRGVLATKAIGLGRSSGTGEPEDLSEWGGPSVYLSQGGYGGTFISTAGEIKVYTGVNVE